MPGEVSRSLYEKALTLFPGGVNSPVRAAVKPYPFYVERAEGPYIYTVDGEKLIDYVLAYGPLILGHKHPRVEEAVRRQLEKGWLYGAPYELEIRLAEKILKYYHPGGMVRFVNTGTEATMTAIRLARGVTGRKYIVKFNGCYHGAHDAVLVGAGSAAAEYGVPTSKGIPEEVAKLTLVAKYNDIESVEKIMSKHGDEVAAIIVEPVAGNAGVIPPKKGFLQELRRIASEHGALLIMDEVITGFRLALGGAQEYYRVKADITTLGKIVGGGFPIGVVVADRKIMEHLTPSGKVFNAGTFNAHPVTMAAGLATIEVLEEGTPYRVASEAGRALAEELESLVLSYGIDAAVNHVESMLQIFFVKGEVWSPEDAAKSDKKLYLKLHEELLKLGVFIAPSQMEAIFTSAAHTSDVVSETIEKLRKAFKRLR
ncbi:glutamate-1-semialdehyde 2,1-aminomutase [Hyperthermus butylicus]|uniref:Glutamate-1-semialdehyde 2,1-aminomutase n=1 Tax=Hyperthermus butylicus (strain DSM 5456 / JCM 9403 / PLM1-5) TaxID=415426 RepID=GSA_HYPBU|nr:glutamate-1-semialdehyde 2,1-aminomutase [Hyperthermus butylicus]A2BL27.1 RecName: Full=Glutamate-1-semialdehyde 2,1-aminomutase; Short=GSA; AltName: Full=Glutamate-1-semialdehyde aminotransferase; Short=GSA-AT [Hyperthermus butylicus DSM 5456]ABM80688.1 glutamate-1-semialdehyde 2,1-aminomutase [Hyperthermus butylicus DSM 5456]